MGELKNILHEGFAKKMVEHNGIDKQKIMEEAGFKWSSSNFSHLKANPTIKARIVELSRDIVKKNVSIMDLEGRLELLSEFARDTTALQPTRITALRELHHQSGDDIAKVDLDINGECNHVIRFVDIALPKKDDMIQLDVDDFGTDLDDE